MNLYNENLETQIQKIMLDFVSIKTHTGTSMERNANKENLSAGIRSAAYLLEELKEKFKLTYSLMINTEPHDREHEDIGIIHDGPIGKVMPLIKDRKKVYDVSLPPSAGGYMSVLPLKSSPKEVLDLLVNISVEAFDEMINYMHKQYKFYMNQLNKEYNPLQWKSNVKTFMKIYEEAKRDSGNEFTDAFTQTSSEVKVNIEHGTLSLVD